MEGGGTGRSSLWLSRSVATLRNCGSGGLNSTISALVGGTRVSYEIGAGSTMAWTQETDCR